MTGRQDETASSPPFDLLFEQSPDACIFADRNGAIRLWNAAAERVFGYAAPEVLGGSLDVIIPERFRAAHWRGFQQAIDSGSTKYAGRALTTRAVHKDGRSLYVDMTFALLKDRDGAVLGALAVTRDCTEAYLAQKALRERIAQLEKQKT
ncbi:MAG TPA: PAS domain S-box protein [Burkholderiales bacterium]|nr:PAS domain S-box protein [Burkholderiales bacterium]